MSTISPNSLLDLTVDVVARNYESLCDNVPDNFRSNSGENYCYLKLVFKNGHSLPPTISERLLHRLTQTNANTINSDILRLFLDPKVCPLRRFCVGDVAGNECYSKLLWNYVEVLLKRQKLTDVEVRTTVDEFYQDYSDSEIAVSLIYLTMSPVDSTCINFISTFTSLKHLDVSNSNVFGDKELLKLASCLLDLESLDVSSTNVETIDAFGVLRLKLRLLYLHNTPLICRDLSGILRFSNLELLDISQSNNEIPSDEGFQEDMMFDEFLTSSDALNSLVSLDISGAGKVDNNALKWFVETHPKLGFLGLLNVDQSLYTSSSSIPKNVEVTGDESLEQVLACLRRYRNRPSFLIKALKELFGFLPQDSLKHDVEQRRVIVKLLLDLMTKYMHKDQEALQTAASACLFGCVRYDKSKGPESLHTSIISEMVSVLIQLLITYPNEKQIQRNCVIILYNNYILSDAKFDRYLVSKLIFKAISLFSEDNITGVVLDMCAYLSSRISVEETLMLGTLENITKLLSIIDTQVSSNTVDNLLQCGLRFLWNLTDEAPATCRLVMNLDGHLLAIRALQAFDQRNDILTKLLGILNNLAEVVPIRPQLLEEELMSLLRKYLDNGYQLDVCYFAAGIICNLVNDWPAGLWLSCGTQAELLSLVGATVNKWKKVDKVMVGYRTFKSFIPLLLCQFPDAQLWAIWAIYHVCSHKVQRYGTVCKQEGIVDILKDLWRAPESRLDVKNLAMEAANAIENTTDDDNCMAE